MERFATDQNAIVINVDGKNYQFWVVDARDRKLFADNPVREGYLRVLVNYPGGESHSPDFETLTDCYEWAMDLLDEAILDAFEYQQNAFLDWD